MPTRSLRSRRVRSGHGSCRAVGRTTTRRWCLTSTRPTPLCGRFRIAARSAHWPLIRRHHRSSTRARSTSTCGAGTCAHQRASLRSSWPSPQASTHSSCRFSRRAAMVKRWLFRSAVRTMPCTPSTRGRRTPGRRSTRGTTARRSHRWRATRSALQASRTTERWRLCRWRAGWRAR